MRTDETPRRAAALGGLLLLLGLFLMAGGLVLLGPSDRFSRTGDAAEQRLAADSNAEPTESSPAPPDPTLDLRHSDQAPKPISIRIPAIDVEAPMVALGLRADGSIEVPTDFSQTGWWADGPEPGEPGPAVVLGHVDSRSGPAVFFSLTEVQPGDEVIIDRIDGSSVAYRVDRIEQYPKDRFPTDAVYGDTEDPELRLVTCGGDFDRSARSYRDNIVVFATRA